MDLIKENLLIMLKKTFISIFLLSSFGLHPFQNAYAQQGSDDYMVDHKNDLLLVVGGGVAGSILGLSTLSFVEEPQEHTRNILVGASLGVIAGVVLVAMNQAEQSRKLMISRAFDQKAISQVTSVASTAKIFDTRARSAWHFSENQNLTLASSQNGASLTPLGMSFKFNY